MEALLAHNEAVEAHPGAVDVCRPVLQIRVFLLRILDPHHSEKTDPNRREKQDLDPHQDDVDQQYSDKGACYLCPVQWSATCIRSSGVLPVSGAVEFYLYPGQWSATCIRGSGALPVSGAVECYLYRGQWSATCIRSSGVLPVSGAVKRRCTCCTSCRGGLYGYTGTWY